MKLLLNATSPYARMARIAILEKGLEDQVELVWSDPWNNDAYLFNKNPLGRVPTLVTDCGVSLCESLLIGQYLDSLYPETTLTPQGRIEHVLHLCGLGHGLMDAAFLTVIARKYLTNDNSNSVLDTLRIKAIQRSLEQLEQSIEQHSIPDQVSLGDIAVAVAISYIEFRLPEMNSVKNYRLLEEWFSEISARSSFKSTRFD